MESKITGSIRQLEEIRSGAPASGAKWPFADSELYLGACGVDAFASAGFQQVGRAGRRRRVMRLVLSDSAHQEGASRM